MGKKFNLKKITSSREFSLVIVLIVLCVFIQFRNSSFLTASTMSDMFQNYATTFILSLGMMCVLLIGGIDISVGSTIALTGMITALMMRDGFIENTLVAFIVSILVGTVCGMVIGLVISKGKVLPIIATLGFLNIYRGITYLVADSRWVAAYEIPESFKAFAQSKALGVLNNLIIIVIICYAIFFYIMKWTKLGRKIYAVGSNVEAAKISGIKIDNVKLFVYSLMGALAGLCGAMWVSLYASAQGDMADGMEMDAIAACVIGGVSLNGGRGSVIGVFLGSVTIAIIGKALPLIGVSAFWKNAIKGFIIIVAVILNVLTQRVIDKKNLREREI